MSDTFDLRRFMERPSWMAAAECSGLDPDIFYPERGANVGAVKAICRRCAVQAECLAFALNSGETDGVWGGTSPRERRVMRRGRATTATGQIVA